MNDWMAQENLDFAPVVHVPGYRFRTVIPYGDVLFDPMIANWVEPDGSVAICDVGGQPRPGRFDPNLGHGAVWWLRPDDRLEPAVPWGHTGLGMPMFARLAPPSFGYWAGHVLFVAQVAPGRKGAHYDHVVYVWSRNSNRFDLFAILPRSDSSIGKGIPSAAMAGEFGPVGTEHEGAYFCFCARNNTIYRVNGDQTAEPYAVMDGRDGPVLMPRALCFGDDNHFEDYPELRGKMIVGGVPNTNYDAIGDTNAGRAVGQDVAFHVVENGKVQPEPIVVANRMLALTARAGEGFGPLSNRLIYTDHGSIVQTQSIRDDVAYPHDAALLYKDASGQLQPFVTGLRGGRNDIVFSGDRLLISNFGKSYSTGEFHYPDGAIWELTWQG